MRIRQLYLLAGLSWALVLAPMAALMAVAAGAGFAWIYVFGDNPWPRWAELFLLVVGAAAALSVAAAAVVTANAAGKAAADKITNPQSVRRAIGLAIAPIIVALLATGVLWLRAQERERSVAAAAAGEARFADLIASTQKLTALEIGTDSQNVFNAVARFSGSRQGAYDLRWRVVPSSAKRAVLEGRRAVRANAATEALPISFTVDQLREGYRAIVLGGRGGALIDERFRLEVSLAPVLSGDEIGNLPPEEQRRLNTAESPLESRRSADFPVRFTIP